MQITVEMFSGRPNPTWVVKGDQENAILRAVRNNPGIVAKEQGFQGLGYRGVRISADQDSGYDDTAIPSNFWIANGHSEDEAKGIELASQLVEVAFGKPLGVRSLDGATLIDRNVERLILEELGGFEKKVANWQAGLAQKAPAKGEEADPPAPRLELGCEYEFDPYNPNFWNNDLFRLYNNNCYAYACNMATNTFPQPGRANGVYPWMACYSVGPAAMLDGLVLANNCQPYTSAPRYLVALVIAPGVDYHWYRAVAGGFWGHKPGSTPVINTDNSGQIIVDPMTADRGIYTDFCEYMCVPWPDVYIQ